MNLCNAINMHLSQNCYRKIQFHINTLIFAAQKLADLKAWSQSVRKPNPKLLIYVSVTKRVTKRILGISVGR
jgi:hypothetical protein